MQNQKDEEIKKISREICEKKFRLEKLLLEKALPVRRLVIKDDDIKRELRWLIAVVTLVLVLIVLLWTEPRSHGLSHYVREGAMWIVCFIYLFGGCFPLTGPLIDGLSAFKESPKKAKELPDLIWFLMPSIIGWGAAILFFYCYLNRIT